MKSSVVKLLIGIVIILGVCNAGEYFYVSPNPVKDSKVDFCFEYDTDVERVEVRIYDLSCRLIEKDSYTPLKKSGSLPFSIENFKGGLYIWHAEVILAPGIKKEYVKLLGVLR